MTKRIKNVKLILKFILPPNFTKVGDDVLVYINDANLDIWTEVDIAISGDALIWYLGILARYHK